MQFLNRSILNEVARLNMPHPEDVVINHGAALVIRGLRVEHPKGDIDMATCEVNMEYLKSELGFQATRRKFKADDISEEQVAASLHDIAKRFDVHNSDFSRSRHNLTGEGRIYLPEAKAMSDQDLETRFWIAHESYVLLTKEDTNRARDKADVLLIKSHMSQHSKA